MDHFQSHIPHLVQVYHPQPSEFKMHNPHIIHITHPSLGNQGKVTYQQTVSDIHIPAMMPSFQNEMINKNQIFMSCQQAHLQAIQPIQGQVIQGPITSHVLLPTVPVFKQPIMINDVQQYYGYDYGKEPCILTKLEATPIIIEKPIEYEKLEPLQHHALEVTISVERISDETIFDETAMDEIVSNETVGDEAVDDDNDHVETIAVETVLNETVSDENVSDENVSDEAVSDETVSDESISSKKRRRNLTPKPSTWASNIRKIKHQRGEAYVSRRGKYVPERKIRNTKDCLKNCKFKCNARISDSDRELIFKSFYSLSTIEKRHFLLNSTERHDVKKCKTDAKRKHSFKYAFILRSERYTVCKNFYLGTLAISQKPVYNVHSGKSETNIPKPDGRGLSENCTHALPNEVKDRVRSHIMSFTTIDSTPVKQFSDQKQFLLSNLSIKRMYNMYFDHYTREGIEPVKESMYRKIFKREFNLHFTKIKKEEVLDCKSKGNKKKG